MEIMERDRIAKRVYVGECVCSCLLGRLWKRWIDILKECLMKRGLDIKQEMRMFWGKIEWWGFARGNAWAVAQRGMSP